MRQNKKVFLSAVNITILKNLTPAKLGAYQSVVAQALIATEVTNFYIKFFHLYRKLEIELQIGRKLFKADV